MRLLKQSTATTIIVGPVLDASGVAVSTAVIGDFNITKNGTTAAMSGNTIAHSHNGHYAIDLTTANTDTLNRLTITVNNSAMAMAKENFTVLNAATFDTLVTNGTLASTTSGRTLAVDAFGIVTDTAGTTTLLSRLTSTRAGLLDNLDVAISVIQSQITALNNLSAKANWFGSALLEIPDSGTRAYVFELVIKDDEDKLVNLDGLPTITLTNSAGTDRSSLITTGIANAATGRYTLTITVGTSTTNEALLLKATGTVSGETRYAVLATQVVDYDSGALINSIYTRLGVPSTSSIAGDISAVKTVVDAGATASALASLSSKVGTPAGASIAADIAAEKVVVDAISGRIPSALVGGRMDVSVGAMASAVITAASIASGALNGKGDWRTALTLLGSLTETQWANLVAAALLGQTSQPSGATEKFKHLDGSDAFTTTLDSNGNRTNVAIA